MVYSQDELFACNSNINNISSILQARGFDYDQKHLYLSIETGQGNKVLKVDDFILHNIIKPD